MNGPEGASTVVGNSLGRFYSYKNTFDETSIWVDIPRKSMEGLWRFMGIDG